MAVHNSKNKFLARKQASRYRSKGFKASMKRTNGGWKVYTSRGKKGR